MLFSYFLSFLLNVPEVHCYMHKPVPFTRGNSQRSEELNTWYPVGRDRKPLAEPLPPPHKPVNTGGYILQSWV